MLWRESYIFSLCFALGCSISDHSFWRCFGQRVNLTGHKLFVSHGLTCAIWSLGWGAYYKLTVALLCPVGAFVGKQSLWRSRTLWHRELRGLIRLAAASVNFPSRHGDGGRVTLIGWSCCAPLHSGSLGHADCLPVIVFLLAELQSQIIHVFPMKSNTVLWKLISQVMKHKDWKWHDIKLAIRKHTIWKEYAALQCGHMNIWKLLWGWLVNK